MKKSRLFLQEKTGSQVDASKATEEAKKNENFMVKIRQLACFVKETMTTKELSKYKVQLKFEEAPALQNVSFMFSHSELQDIADSFFARTEEIVDDVLEETAWDAEQVTDLVLLGGTSKLSTIRNSIRLKLGHNNLEVHDHVNPDYAVAIGAAAVARQAIGRQSEDPNRLDKFHLQDKTSYSIGVECNDGTVQVFVDKYTDVPSQGISIMQAVQGQKSVLLNIVEGEEELARDNRFIGTFDMEEGTLHAEGVSFNFCWTVDENFDLHVTAYDPEKVKQLVDDGQDKSEAERGVSLTLIGLKDTQIARYSMFIQKMMKKQSFLDDQANLSVQLDRLKNSLALMKMNEGISAYPFIEHSKSWLNSLTAYTNQNHEEVQHRIQDISNFMRKWIRQGLKKS